MADQKKRLPDEQVRRNQNPTAGVQQPSDDFSPSVQGADHMHGAGAPDPALLAAMVQAQGAVQGNAAQGAAPAEAQGTGSLDQPATAFRPVGSRITKEMLQKATRTLHKYRAAKSSVERRIIDAQQWWKLHNWEQIEAQAGVYGGHDSKSNTAWLWNCIVGKHADAMDAYPEPAILPRMADDKEEARMLSDIVPVVLKLNGF
jgi:hypothetical protein